MGVLSPIILWVLIVDACQGTTVPAEVVATSQSLVSPNTVPYESQPIAHGPILTRAHSLLRKATGVNVGNIRLLCNSADQHLYYLHPA